MLLVAWGDWLVNLVREMLREAKLGFGGDYRCFLMLGWAYGALPLRRGSGQDCFRCATLESLKRHGLTDGYFE